MTGTELVLCVVVPDLCIAVFVGGHVWRYRYDTFSGTTRSNQLYGRRLLRVASRLLHFGSSRALGGHLMGLLIPKSWTDAAGIPEFAHHALSLTLGTIAEG